MQFDWRIRLALILGGLTLIGLFAVLEATLGFDAGEYLKDLGQLIGAVIVGLGLAGGPQKGALLALLFVACAPSHAQCDAIGTIKALSEITYLAISSTTESEVEKYFELAFAIIEQVVDWFCNEDTPIPPNPYIENH